MSLTGNVIDVQKIQLTDTFQTWFAKTNEMVDALNPVNIYDIDDGAGTNVTYGLTGTAYNGVKYVNVNAGYGVAVGGGSAKPWTGVVGLDISSISGNAYTLTGNPDYTITGGSPRTSEVNIEDYFLVQDISDTAQGASGTTKRVQAKYMLPREIYQPTLDFYGDLVIKGKFSAVGPASTQVGSLSINSQFVYLATTGSAGSTAGAYSTDNALGSGGVIIAMTGGIPNKEFVWNYNGASNKSYWSFNTPFGAKEPNLPLVASKFISRDFISGTTANTFIFEVGNGQSNKFWLTESGSNPYFGIVKDINSSNVNLNVYNGAGITSVAYIIAGTTSQYTGVTANAFIQYANVDMVDGANATTGASAWTIPVSDQLGQIYAERHNAGQIKRRFTQTSHGLTTGQAVAVIIQGAASGTPGTITGAQANSTSTEAFGIVDRVISANEFSVTMKGYMDLSSNGLFGIGRAITGQTYYLDWAVKGGLTTNTNVPSSQLYQPLFMALGASSGIVYGNEADVIFPYAQDQVYMRGMVPIGVIQPYAGDLAGLSLGLSGGSIPVSDVQYNDNWMPCDGRALPATGASGFVDLFNLIGYTYSMRGVVQSSGGAANTVIRPDRGTANLGSLGLGLLAGNIRVIKRTGTDSVNIAKTYSYTGLTADGTTITLVGLSTVDGNGIGANVLVDILSPKDGSYFFAPDLRGKAPFGEYAPYGARGEGFSLTAGATGGTATGDGGLFTNYLIRAKRDSDAMILTGHNHDSRYLRKDASDSVALAGSTLTLQNLNILGQIGTNIGIGLSPIADNGTNKVAYPLSVLKNGDFETWISVYNQTDGAGSLAGFRMNNFVGNASLALNRATSSTLTLSTDASCSGGILFSAGGNTGPVRIATVSTERMRITPTGNVGIGTSTPSYRLTLQSTPSAGTPQGIGTDGTITQIFSYQTNDGTNPPVAYSGTLSNHTYGLIANNSAKMFIAPSGNIGIGISNPGNALVVQCTNSGVDGIVVRNGDGGAYANIIAGGSNSVGTVTSWTNKSFIFEGVPQGSGDTIVGTYRNNLVFQTNERINRMQIDPAGNVSIGSNVTAQCRLNIYDSLAGSNGILAHFRNTKADTGRSGAFLQITQAGVQDWTIGQPPDTDAFTIYQGRNASAVGNERLRITSVGNVGIGISNPLTPLSVSGTIFASDSIGVGITAPTLNATGKFIHIHSDTNNTAAATHYTTKDTGSGAGGGLLVGYWSDQDAYVFNYQNTNLRLGTNGSTRMIIDGSGVIRTGTLANSTFTPTASHHHIAVNDTRSGLVGCYDPTDTQQIWSIGNSYNLPQGSGYTSGQYGDFYGIGWSYNPGYTGTAGQVNRFGGPGAATFTNPQSKTNLGHQMLVMWNGVTKTAIGNGVWTSGDVYAVGNVTAYSDSRYKEDINTIENALAKTTALNGVTYTDKETKQRRMGLVAQEVKKVIPEVVIVNGVEEVHSLAYGNLVGLLIEAIKELNTKVDSLSAKVEQLSSKGSE